MSRKIAAVVLLCNFLSFCMSTPPESIWTAPDISGVPATEQGELIRYGQQLVAHTADYYGPRGKIGHLTNGMNCQNCHLKAGTQPWGNNFGAVFSTYPKFRERRGAVEDATQRVTDCFERSLNGIAPDSNSREMKAILAYMKWLGDKVPKGKKPLGSGIETLPFLLQAADTLKGRTVYVSKCQVCHGVSGQGMLSGDSLNYTYPPLWGEHSYNTGAGLYRLSRFAGFVRDNMPFGADYQKVQLTDEEAWDLAAFVNSQPRPQKPFAHDWPNPALKPVDHPFGPYTDSFSEQQHKYGPFAPIQKAKKNKA
ncbi:MAG: c-type cytochrome [Bacteroidetes bacterium]|nr:c-type cytochrome [Bacteroidota bacterium]